MYDVRVHVICLALSLLISSIAVDVIVTHINSPTEFYIQYKSELPSLNVFYNELGGSSLQNISDLQISKYSMCIYSTCTRHSLCCICGIYDEVSLAKVPVL